MVTGAWSQSARGPSSRRSRIAWTALGLGDRASLRGYVDQAELPEVYRQSHFLLITSHTEGLPQVVLEAFAAGLPVVSTDVGGIAEAVGEAVALVEPEDTVGAADAIRRIAGDAELRAALIAAGHPTSRPTRSTRRSTGWPICSKPRS